MRLNGGVISFTEHDRLGAAEELELARKYRAGDMRARERLITSNIALIRYWIIKLVGRCEPDRFDELFQCAMEGLIRAVEKFDPDRGLRLSTYVTPWIRHYIYDCMHNNRTIVKLRRDDAIITKREEIEKRVACGETYESVAKTMKAYSGSKSRTTGPRLEAMLYAARGFSSVEGLRELPAANDGPESLVMKRDLEVKREYALENAMKTLSDRERTVITLRLAGKSYEEAGRAINRTREIGRRVEAAALAKLTEYCRSYLEAS